MNNKIVPLNELENGNSKVVIVDQEKGFAPQRPKYIADRQSSVWPLFWYPLWVNNNTARFIGLYHIPFLICGIIFRNTPMMNKIVGGIFISYTLIFLAGGRASPIGLLAEFSSQWKKPEIIFGAQKQFAAFCCVIMSGPAAAMLLFEPKDHGKPGHSEANPKHHLYGHDHYGGVIIAACILLAMQAGACFLEATVNFCLGCKMFQLGAKIGLVHPLVDKKADSGYQEAINLIDEDYDPPAKIKKPTVNRFAIGPNGELTGVDFEYKGGSDDFKAYDFHMIRHHQITYFISCMGLVGIALLWRIAQDSKQMQPGYDLWYAFGVFAAICFIFSGILYILKFILYPKKVIKEWYHPVKSNAFSVIPITICLFAALVFRHYHWSNRDNLPQHKNTEFHDWNREYKALWWTGSMMQLTLACVAVGRWFSEGPMYIQHANPTMLIPPLGLFVAAFSGARYQNELCWLFFSFALFMWLILMPITMGRSFFYYQLEDKLRPTVFIYLAAAAVACISYVELNRGVWNDFAHILFWFSWGIFFTLGCMTLQRFFGQVKFEMGAWSYLFPLAVFAAVTIEYNDTFRSRLALPMAIVAMSFANLAAVQLLLMTLIACTRPARKQMWVPDDKWGPVSFMRVWHEAFRASAKKLVKLAGRVDVSKPETLKTFLTEFNLYEYSLNEHAEHEDKIFFASLAEYFPGINAASLKEHEEVHINFDKVKEYANDLLIGKADVLPTIESLKTAMSALEVDMDLHFEAEEELMQSCFRKNKSLEEALEIGRKIFLFTPTNKWLIILPWIIANCPLHNQRIKFLRSMGWAVPEHRQHIGRMLYLGIDPFIYERIVERLPEFVPRLTEEYPPGLTQEVFRWQRAYRWRRYW